MSTFTLIAILLALTSVAYFLGLRRSHALAMPLGGIRRLHSLPSYYGLMTSVWCAIPALLVVLLWIGFEEQIILSIVVNSLPADIVDQSQQRIDLFVSETKNVARGVIQSSGEYAAVLDQAAARYLALKQTSQAAMAVVVLSLAIAGLAWGWGRIRPELRARNQFEKVVKGFLVLSSSIAILTTIGIVLSVVFESIRFFQKVPLTEFLFGLHWSPQIALRPDQAGSSGAFGAIPLFAGTMLISFIAMVVAVPIGLMSAIYLAEYASNRVRSVVKPLLEVLAGIPTVVYGFFAALTAAPFIRDLGGVVGLDVTSESALAAGLVMGVMIIPFVSSLADDVINAVPQSLRDGSYGLGATRSETIRQVIIPAALPGIVGGVLLAVSRAIGETMIVVMAAGLAAKLTLNPLDTVTTVTVQIVTLLVGDQEFDSAKTLAAFALGLMLFIVTLALNVIALNVVKKYREQYD